MKAIVIKQNVGIDISKDNFKVCFYQLLQNQRQRIKGTRTFANTVNGFREFLKWVEKHQDANATVRITVEATGVYYEQLVHFLNDHSAFYLSVVLPNKAKAYFKSHNVKTKTDKVDAKLLGLMGLERDLTRWQPMSPKIRSIKQLSRDRISMIEERIALSNKMHALNHSYQPHKDILKRMNKRLNLLIKQIKQVEKQMILAVKADEVLNERIQKVCLIKGLGLITVVSIVAETDGFALFTSRTQLTSYAGYDIVERESGTSIKGKTRISKKGNRFIRRALHFPALVVVKHEPPFTQLYERVFQRSLVKMKAYVAVQRKLLLLIYALFTKNEAYDPNYAKKQIVQKISRQDTSPAYAG